MREGVLQADRKMKDRKMRPGPRRRRHFPVTNLPVMPRAGWQSAGQGVAWRRNFSPRRFRAKKLLLNELPRNDVINSPGSQDFSPGDDLIGRFSQEQADASRFQQVT
jgi:hypothetical protein